MGLKWGGAGQRWAVTRAWNACPLNGAGPTIASPNKTINTAEEAVGSR